jgi:pimeloyl-ACP methyl ester carboxylesterase
MTAARAAGPALMVVLAAGTLHAQGLPPGTIVEDVKCAADPSQSYALYIPSAYSPDRKWSLLIAFHPGARGRAMVEKYVAAAEQYGYIVAGSNNSRNGPWSVSAAAIQAMPADLGRRFSIDSQRIYLTGLSGGARVALTLALGKNNNIAGVIASSAGYPDSTPRTTLAFPLFATAGTEDFNYLEMRLLDRKLTTAHHLAIFEGGHSLPTDAVALEAIEWMELQAMKTGRRPRDEALLDRLLEKRRQLVAAATDPVGIVHLLDSLAADFSGLRDVSAESARATDLAKQPEVKKALARERSADEAEERTLGDIFRLEAELGDESRRSEALIRLRSELVKVSRAAGAADDTPERQRARRVLRAITAGAGERVQDPQYLALLQQYRPAGR